jgi:hypothetical protein
MTWLLRLYPREWRRRYGAEIEEVVASQPKSLQLVVDLLGGAVDAHLKPQAFARRLDGATAADRGGLDMVNRMKGCGATASVSRKDAFLGAGLTLGSALVVATIMVIGRSPITETIGLTMFPGVLAVGTQSMYLRGHSTLAKVVLIGGPFVVLFLIGLLAGLAVSD